MSQNDTVSDFAFAVVGFVDIIGFGGNRDGGGRGGGARGCDGGGNRNAGSRYWLQLATMRAACPEVNDFMHASSE